MKPLFWSKEKRSRSSALPQVTPVYGSSISRAKVWISMTSTLRYIEREFLPIEKDCENKKATYRIAGGLAKDSFNYSHEYKIQRKGRWANNPP
jgi:hypothetical protein